MGERNRVAYTSQSMLDDLLEIAPKLKEEKFDTIVCPLRGALSITQVLSYQLGIKNIVTVNISKAYSENEPDVVLYSEIPDLSDSKVLIVDDISDTGVTLSLLKKHIPNAKVYTIFYNRGSILKPDYYSRETNDWIDFWWEANNDPS